MRLLKLMVFMDADETVHIIDEVHKKTLFFGKLGNAPLEIGDTIYRLRVNRIYSGFSGICIDTVEKE